MKLRTKADLTDAPSERELKNLQIAYEAACQGIVLLKNDGTLPLTNQKVALYGPGASMTIKGGTGSGEVNERHSVSVLEGLKDRGFAITTTGWIEAFEQQYRLELERYRKEKKRRVNYLKFQSIMDMLFDNFRFPEGPEITQADVAASDTDTCIYILSRQAGEGGDRRPEKGDLYLTDREEQAIRFCAEQYTHFVLVINCGSAMDVSFLERIPGINAVVYLCQLGTEGGHALADVLSGARTPSGKLADTWAKRYEDIPFANEYSYLNADADNEYYKEDIFVGYRYFDTFGVEPAFPFGFGLSYTDFSVAPEQLELEGSRFRMVVRVGNVGTRYDGAEVVQAYVSPPASPLGREHQMLATFGKTRQLAPGQSACVPLEFDLRELAAFREADQSFVLEAGTYLVRLGNSSRSTVPVAAITLTREWVVSVHQSICPVQKSFRRLQAPPRQEQVPSGVAVFEADLSQLATKVHTYQPPRPCFEEEVQNHLRQLTDRQMVQLLVGIGMFGGKTRFTLPGAVGNTTSRFWDRGLANMTLCDGPAGLRIQKRSTVTKGGVVKPLEMAMSVYELIPGFLRKLITGNPKKETPLYQYTTAFPVATALAQSWNTALLEQVGQAVGAEMAHYGATYWLAPAVNIHRNVLCGRNFEYFSEDPFLTGSMAAAVIRGVQARPGHYVTVKHFACNNQEENRNYSDSCLSQRALREIYLPGFRMAVEAGAKGVMTSYNKLNGVYTANSYDLCTRLLRNEWGFDGVVMTDWYATNRGQAETDRCIAAGNDLIMPGTGRDKRSILRGLKKGTVSRQQLQLCCGNVIRAILQSNIQREYIAKETVHPER